MEHYVLIKFRPGYLSEDKINKIKTVYAEMKANIDGIEEIYVEQNCVERNVNMDLMIRILFSHKKQLDIYLKHPLHMDLADDMNPHIMQRVSFDCRPQK